MKKRTERRPKEEDEKKGGFATHTRTHPRQKKKNEQTKGREKGPDSTRRKTRGEVRIPPRSGARWRNKSRRDRTWARPRLVQSPDSRRRGKGPVTTPREGSRLKTEKP